MAVLGNVKGHRRSSSSWHGLVEWQVARHQEEGQVTNPHLDERPGELIVVSAVEEAGCAALVPQATRPPDPGPFLRA